MKNSAPGVRGIVIAATALSLCAVLSSCASPRPGSTPLPSDVETSPTASAPSTPSAAPSSPAPVAPPTPAPSSSGSGKKVDVIVITLDVAGGNVEISGMVPQLVEDGGTCTLTLTQGSLTRTVSGGTTAAQQSTYCSLLTYPTSQLASGQWQAVLGYRSAAHEGASSSQTVTVP